MADIKLKDFTGDTQNYTDVPKIWLESADSTEESPVLLPFSYGEPINMSVDPDFSGGNMIVDIPKGQLVSDLIIQKPPTLVPMNVAKGINIAGIIGTMAAGDDDGDSSNLKITSGDINIPGYLFLDTGTPNLGNGKWRKDGDGYWVTYIDGLRIPVVEGDWLTWRYECYGVGQVFSREWQNYGTYGHCIVMGNEGIGNGDFEYGLGQEAPFVLIYRVDINQTIVKIASTNFPRYLAGVEYAQSDAKLVIYGSDSMYRTIKFSHGQDKKPDAVFLFEASWPSYSIGEYCVAAWGIKSSLSYITSDNSVGCIITGAQASKTNINSLDYDVENWDRNHYLHCINEMTVQMAAYFAPGTTYRWFAFWGLTGET